MTFTGISLLTPDSRAKAQISINLCKQDGNKTRGTRTAHFPSPSLSLSALDVLCYSRQSGTLTWRSVPFKHRPKSMLPQSLLNTNKASRNLSCTIFNHSYSEHTYEAVEHGAGHTDGQAHGERGQGSVAQETQTRKSCTITGKTILPPADALAALTPIFSSPAHTQS